MWECEIDRVRAVLLRRRGDTTGAEASLRRALAQAQAQQARPLASRAAHDLQDLLAGVAATAAPSPAGESRPAALSVP